MSKRMADDHRKEAEKYLLAAARAEAIGDNRHAEHLRALRRDLLRRALVEDFDILQSALAADVT